MLVTASGMTLTPFRIQGVGAMKIVIEDVQKMNLLGLMLANIMERNLTNPTKQQAIRQIQGDVVIRAGEMVITLRFENNTIHIFRGAVDRPRAAIHGSLDTLMRLSLGGGMIRPVLTSKLKPQGNLFLLLKLRRLLQIE
jgi:hypothetical protein